MSAKVTHVVAGGFCVVCGDTEEWLRERYGDAAVVEQGDHRSFGGSSWAAT